ncbi:MAG: hypothetical protein LUD07_08905 [Clostridiales bacterium]|nr:hypothetical protein [Clostridiales bacterium]
MKRNWKKQIGFLTAIVVFSAACAFTSLAKTKLDTPEGLYWSGTSKEDDSDYDEGSWAKWDEVENVKKYELTLYCEDENGSVSTMASGVTTKKNYYNFRSKMTKSGDYYFRVRAVASGSTYSTSSWSSYSDYYYVSESGAENVVNGTDTESTAVAVIRDNGWVSDETGWWYKNTDGSYPAGGWFQDPSDQNWYYMNEQGYMQSGWIDDNGATYYCDLNGSPSGAMVTGEVVIDNVTYQFDESGVLIE